MKQLMILSSLAAIGCAEADVTVRHERASYPTCAFTATESKQFNRIRTGSQYLYVHRTSGYACTTLIKSK